MMLLPTPTSELIATLLSASTDVDGGNAAEAVNAALAGYTFSDAILAIAAQLGTMAEAMLQHQSAPSKTEAASELLGILAFCVLRTEGADHDA